MAESGEAKLLYRRFRHIKDVSLKEAQAQARHATPEMTMNVYGLVQEDRLSDAVEKVAESILPQGFVA